VAARVAASPRSPTSIAAFPRRAASNTIAMAPAVSRSSSIRSRNAPTTDSPGVAPGGTPAEPARRANVSIYTVTLFDPDNRDARPAVLKTLARETGGRVFTARRTEDVVRAFTRIAQEIRSGYSIGFAPPQAAEGGFRSIRVAVDAGDHRQLVARTRAGYYAEPSGATVR